MRDVFYSLRSKNLETLREGKISFSKKIEFDNFEGDMPSRIIQTDRRTEFYDEKNRALGFWLRLITGLEERVSFINLVLN